MTVINTYDKPAGEIRKGNYIFGQKVINTEPKRVNTTITLAEPVDGRQRWVFKLTDLLEVGVEERTPEEIEERRLESIELSKSMLVDAVNSWIESALKGVDEAVEYMTTRRAEGWTALDYSAIDGYLDAAAKDKVARLLKNDLDDAIDNHGMNPVDAVINVLNHEAKGFARRAMNLRVLHRSSSMTSNLCADLELAAWGGLFDSLNWKTSGIPELNIPSKY